MDVTIIVGNPNPNSRTSTVARTVVEELLGSANYKLRIVELAEHSSELFVQDSAVLDEIRSDCSASDLLVCASPTFKATYTGLLKAFLDRFESRGLQGVVSIPVQTGANDGHSLSVSHSLTPLLTELGAILPGPGIYLPMTEFDELTNVISPVIDLYRNNLYRLAKFHRAIATSSA